MNWSHKVLMQSRSHKQTTLSNNNTHFLESQDPNYRPKALNRSRKYKATFQIDGIQKIFFKLVSNLVMDSAGKRIVEGGCQAMISLSWIQSDSLACLLCFIFAVSRNLRNFLMDPADSSLDTTQTISDISLINPKSFNGMMCIKRNYLKFILLISWH